MLLLVIACDAAGERALGTSLGAGGGSADARILDSVNISGYDASLHRSGKSNKAGKDQRSLVRLRPRRARVCMCVCVYVCMCVCVCLRINRFSRPLHLLQVSAKDVASIIGALQRPVLHSM